MTFNALASGSDTAFVDGSTTPTPYAPGANRLVLAALLIVGGALRDFVSVSGNGLTWVQVANVTWNSVATPLYRIGLYRAMGAAPTSTGLTIDVDGTITGAAWSIVEFDGVDTGGTNGSAAILQPTTNRGDAITALQVTLGAFGSADNATFGCHGVSRAVTVTHDPAFTEISDTTMASPNTGFQAQYLLGNHTTVDWSGYASSSAGAIACEIKAAAVGGGGGIVRQMLQHHHARSLPFRPRRERGPVIVTPTLRQVLDINRRAA